jgi:hypothetical protein
MLHTIDESFRFKVVILNLFGKSQLLSFGDLIDDGFTFLSFVCW